MTTHDPAILRPLLERVMAALEPDRQLDAEIMFSLFAVPVGDNGFLWPDDDASWSFAIRFPGKDAAWFTSKSMRKGKETALWSKCTRM